MKKCRLCISINFSPIFVPLVFFFGTPYIISLRATTLMMKIREYFPAYTRKDKRPPRHDEWSAQSEGSKKKKKNEEIVEKMGKKVAIDEYAISSAVL